MFFKYFFSPESILLIDIICTINSFGFKYPNLSASNNWVSSSANEPHAIPINLRISLSELLAQPSAIFDGIETAARFI